MIETIGRILLLVIIACIALLAISSIIWLLIGIWKEIRS